MIQIAAKEPERHSVWVALFEKHTHHLTIPEVGVPKGHSLQYGHAKITRLKFAFYEFITREVGLGKITFPEGAVLIFALRDRLLFKPDCYKFTVLNGVTCHQ